LQYGLDPDDPQRGLRIKWGALRFQHTAAIRAQLLDRYAPATVNGMLSALRGVLKAAWELGYMTAEDYQRAASVKTVKGETLPAGRDLKQGEILALANVCIADTSPAGVRDAAIIAVLYTCALRRAEVINLDLDHFDPDSGQIKVISGKGRKDRTVYATNGTLDVILDWIAVRGREPGALFTPVNKGGNIQYRRMTSQAIYNGRRKRAGEANVTDFSPHAFSRTFAGDMLDRGADIVTVPKLMGHASVNTTGRYDRRPEEAKKQASQKLHFPYTRQDNRHS
jgi:integrase